MHADDQPEADTADTPDSATCLRAAMVISMAMDPPPKGAPFPTPERIAAMAEPTSSAGAGVLLLKLLPAGVGAAIMVAVDPPANKRELFARIFVAFAASYLFGDVVFDMLHSLSWFAFLDPAKRAHSAAVDGVVGALGWFVLGGVSMLAKRFKADPVGAVKELRP